MNNCAKNNPEKSNVTPAMHSDSASVRSKGPRLKRTLKIQIANKYYMKRQDFEHQIEKLKIHDQISEPDKPCWKIEYKTYLIISIEPLNTKSKIADTCSNTKQTKNPKNQVHRLSKIDQNWSHHKKFEQSNLKNLTRIQVNNKYVKIQLQIQWTSHCSKIKNEQVHDY